MKETASKIIARLDVYAMHQYGRGGWDHWIEAHTYADKVALVGRCRTYDAARRKVQQVLKGVQQ